MTPKEEIVDIHISLGALTSKQVALYSSLDSEVIEEVHKENDCFQKNNAGEWVVVL